MDERSTVVFVVVGVLGALLTSCADEIGGAIRVVLDPPRQELTCQEIIEPLLEAGWASVEVEGCHDTPQANPNPTVIATAEP